VVKTITEPIGYKALVGETPVGCYKDSGRRDLEKRLNTRNPRKCFELAMAGGY